MVVKILLELVQLMNQESSVGDIVDRAILALGNEP